jgi:hypothetical protein
MTLAVARSTSINGTELLQYALAHLWVGEATIPIYRKEPLVKWKKWQKRLPTDADLSGMPWNEADGLGLVLSLSENECGRYGWVLDIEVEHRPDAERWLDVHMPGWRTSRTVETGSGGLHVYCQYYHPVPSTKMRWGDVKGGGSLVYLPPSAHPSGGNYRWLSHGEPMFLAPAKLPGMQSAVRPQSNRPIEAAVDRHREALSDQDLGQVITEMVNDERHLPRLLSLLEIDRNATVGGRAFLCPFCNERRPSASLWRGPNGRIVVRCWHAHAGRCPADEYNLLATVYAAKQTGHFERLSNTQLAAWTLRLLRDAGIVQAPKPDLVLPSGMSSAARRLVRGIAEIESIAAQVFGRDVPVAFTREFAVVWTGLTAHRITVAWKALKGMGIVQKFGSSAKWALWKIRSIWRPTAASNGQSATTATLRDERGPTHNALGRQRPVYSRSRNGGATENPGKRIRPPGG